MKRLFLPLFLLCLLVPVSGVAQTEIEGFVGAYDPETDLQNVDFDNGTATGVRIGQSFLGVLGGEFSYTAATGVQSEFGSFDETVHLLSVNFLGQLPVGPFVPFATLGLGGIVGKDDGDIRIRSALAWNAGGGLKLRNLLGPLGARFDLRYYHVTNGIEFLELPDLSRENFNLLEVSGGIMLSF